MDEILKARMIEFLDREDAKLEDKRRQRIIDIERNRFAIRFRVCENEMLSDYCLKKRSFEEQEATGFIKYYIDRYDAKHGTNEPSQEYKDLFPMIYKKEG